MPFKFNRLALLANIFSLQFTEISEYQPSSSYRASKSRFFPYIHCTFCRVCPTTKMASATVKPSTAIWPYYLFSISGLLFNVCEHTRQREAADKKKSPRKTQSRIKKKSRMKKKSLMKKRSRMKKKSMSLPGHRTTLRNVRIALLQHRKKTHFFAEYQLY